MDLTTKPCHQSFNPLWQLGALQIYLTSVLRIHITYFWPIQLRILQMEFQHHNESYLIYFTFFLIGCYILDASKIAHVLGAMQHSWLLSYILRFIPHISSENLKHCNEDSTLVDTTLLWGGLNMTDWFDRIDWIPSELYNLVDISIRSRITHYSLYY